MTDFDDDFGDDFDFVDGFADGDNNADVRQEVGHAVLALQQAVVTVLSGRGCVVVGVCTMMATMTMMIVMRPCCFS